MIDTYEWVDWPSVDPGITVHSTADAQWHHPENLERAFCKMPKCKLITTALTMGGGGSCSLATSR